MKKLRYCLSCKWAIDEESVIQSDYSWSEMFHFQSLPLLAFVLFMGSISVVQHQHASAEGLAVVSAFALLLTPPAIGAYHYKKESEQPS